MEADYNEEEYDFFFRNCSPRAVPNYYRFDSHAIDAILRDLGSLVALPRRPLRRRPGPAPEWRQRGGPEVHGGLCDIRVGVALVQHGVLPAVHDHGRDAPDPEDRDRVLEEELEKSLGRGGGGV